MEFTFHPLVGIAIAAVLGGTIGIQRQAAAKPAGFRTHLLVATAAAAFTAMGAHLHDTRIPSYIVVGIGFLGGGAIVRDGATPHGLTTAASIWVASAAGLLMGYSDSFGLFAALVLTAITLTALSLSDDGIMSLFRIPRKATMRVTCVSRQISAGSIAEAMRRAKVRFQATQVAAVSAEGSDEILDLVYLVDVPLGRDLNALVREMSALEGVRRVEAAEPFLR